MADQIVSRKEFIMTKSELINKYELTPDRTLARLTGVNNSPYPIYIGVNGKGNKHRFTIVADEKFVWLAGKTLWLPEDEVALELTNTMNLKLVSYETDKNKQDR